MSADCPICSRPFRSLIELAEHEARVHGGPYERLRRCSALATAWTREAAFDLGDSGDARLACATELREVLGGH